MLLVFVDSIFSVRDIRVQDCSLLFFPNTYNVILIFLLRDTKKELGMKIKKVVGENFLFWKFLMFSEIGISKKS